jgi:MULE transposase domain
MHDLTAAVLRKDVYNRRAKFTKRSLGDISPIQALLFHFEENRDFICYYHVNEENRLDRLLWIHRDMLKLLKLNSEILIMDIIFKTNKFQMKLFNIVGVTFFNITFYLVFVFLTHKAIFNFEWVFTRLNECTSNSKYVTRRRS